jgi:parvulin-like peptidyl-prolyl isomerase
VRQFAKKYGSVFGFYLGNTPFVVITDFQDIKEILKKDEVS